MTTSLPTRSRSAAKGAVVAIEELLLVPCYASPRRAAWKALHGALALPLTAWGRERHVVARTDDEEITVAAIGNIQRVRMLLGGWFDAVSAPLDTGASHPLWSPTSLSRMRGAVRIAEIHRWMAPRFRVAGWTIIPNSVRWGGELASIPPHPASSSLKSDLKKVRDVGFDLECAGSSADWEQFFSEMVRPTALARFGDAAWILSARLRRAFSRAGTLLFVRAGGTRLGGVCVIRTRESAWIPVIGGVQRQGAPLRQGVGAAIYALTFEWARSQGIIRMDLGRTAPFVNDPIAWYKRKWGLQPVRDPLSHRFAITADSGCHLWERVIARNPILVEDETGLARFAG